MKHLADVLARQLLINTFERLSSLAHNTNIGFGSFVPVWDFFGTLFFALESL